MNGDTILNVRGLTVRFGTLVAVSDVSFDAQRGHITSVIGPNGAGKSSLFNLISGAIRPSAGQVLFEGRDMTGQRPDKMLAAGLARSFQITNLFFELPVRENLRLAAQFVENGRGLFRGIAASRVALARVDELIEQGRLGQSLSARYGEVHEVRTDAALYDYVQALKSRFLRSADPLAKVVYDNKLHAVRNALGTHTTVARVQGGRLKAKREIRIAGLFRQAPAPFLKMIAVHELAHLKEREHGKPFYALCTHMEPAYHQLEFDVRLWLTSLELDAAAARPGPR